MMSKPATDELRGHFAAVRGLFVTVGAFSFAINMLMLAPSIYMLQVYDRVLTSRNATTLLMLTLIVLGLFALEALLEGVRSRALIRGSAALDLKLGPRVFDASFQRTLRGRAGNASQSLGDLASLRQFLTGKGLFAFFDAPWTPIYLLVIFLLSPWLGLFALVAAVILLALAWINEKMTAPLLGEASKEAQVANHYAGSHLRNAEVIDAMGMLGALRQRWLRKQGHMLVLQARASDRAASVGAWSRLARMGFQSGVLGLGALLVIDNQLSPGGMIAASILLGRALAPVDQAIGNWRSLVQARGAYRRLDELLAAHPPAAERTALPRPRGFVQADNLAVGPPGVRVPVLKGIKFGAKPGMLVVVVGPSAAGKSTLARALVGVWSPLGGAVRLDGAEVHTWDKEELGPHIGYLPQDVELFEGTVAENIARFGVADDGRIVQAAKRAGVHELILRLPQGYETPLGEGGTALSGGQRQRIGLARAMYGEPALVVLDEPNANLDEAGDAALVEALGQMRRDQRTVSVMSHRMNILALADAVMMLANGSIQMYGPRDEVMKALAAQHKPGPNAAGPQAAGKDAVQENAA